MKKFKPFDKVLVRHRSDDYWVPTFYKFNDGIAYHFVLDETFSITDSYIIPYEGNEHLAGTIGEPEEKITLAVGELILMSDNVNVLSEGRGTVLYYKEIVGKTIISMNRQGYTYCIPISKYNPNNLEETRKWILTVKDGKLVKVNK